MQTIEDASKNSPSVMPATQADSAVGVPKRNWFVAIVKRNTEKSCRDKLNKMGYESYVATQTELRKWSNGTKKTVERVVISAIVFIKATEQERRFLVTLPFINKFMTDKSGQKNPYGRSPIATIPDSQMQTLQFMLYNADSEVIFTDTPFRLGDSIRVIRGSLKNFCGNIVKTNGTTYVVVNLDLLGTAMTRISISDIEKI